jgi:multisubunit Na+/H+ antiporter MnhB subunit
LCVCFKSFIYSLLLISRKRRPASLKNWDIVYFEYREWRLHNKVVFILFDLVVTDTPGEFTVFLLVSIPLLL